MKSKGGAMSNTPDTNQASEDELRKWWWECNGTGTDACSKCRNGMMCSWHSARLDDLQALLRTEKLKLLAEVRERVVGEDKKPTGSMTGLITIDTARNELRAEMRNELTKLEAEL